jgi:DNA-binding LacI/PurR family transcriptional regulator
LFYSLCLLTITARHAIIFVRKPVAQPVLRSAGIKRNFSDVRFSTSYQGRTAAMRRVTIKDVAERAGVSKSTVSHAINNTRFLEPGTRQRVMQAIEELNFHPSSLARSLTTHHTNTIGLVVSEISNSFFSDILRGIEDRTRQHNYSFIVCNTGEILEQEDRYLDLLLSQRVDGIIAAATSQRWEALSKASLQHTPVVYVDRSFEGMEGPFVGVDNRQGAWLGASHLIQCGHRQIGILAGFQRLSTMRERLEGFCRALDENNLPLPEEWMIPSPLSIEAGKAAALQLLSQANRPSALFINNNLLTLGALKAIQQLGLRCPQDIGIVGFDDFPWAEVTCPPLSVVRQPAREVGQKAAEILLHLINDEPVDKPRVVLDCELVVRSSSC